MNRFVPDDDESREHPPLPSGEPVLWQGSPLLWPLARDAFHVRKLAIYFVLLAAWSIASGVADHQSATDIAGAVARVAFLAALGLGVVLFIAWRTVRATTYIVTSKRVVFRIGVALPMTINVPLSSIQSVCLKTNADGSGDLALTLGARDHLAWLHLWPNVRPWRLRHPEPAFRGIPDVQRAAAVLATALDPSGQAQQQTTKARSTPDSAPPYAPALS